MEQAWDVVRSIALLTEDKPVQRALLQILGEHAEEALARLEPTVWWRPYIAGAEYLQIALSVVAPLIDRSADEHGALGASALTTNDPWTRALLLTLLREDVDQLKAGLQIDPWKDALGSDPATQRANMLAVLSTHLKGLK
jgi:hypothetical protein